jgi:hypothetical protein
MTDDFGSAAERRTMRSISDLYDAESGPVPAALTQFALDAFRWRDLDAQLASITFDSATDQLVGVRGTAERHLVRYSGAGLTVSLSLADASLTVMIEPAGEYHCRIEGPDVAVSMDSDEAGQLSLDDCPLPLRLVVENDPRRLMTPWLIG